MRMRRFLVSTTVVSAVSDMSENSKWLSGPCAFHLSRSYSTKCCACDGRFGFVSRGHVCEFCGYFCHKSRGCSRLLWLSREVLRRRICSRCDRYRKVSGDLRRGADFTFCDKSRRSRVVTLSVDEHTGSLLIMNKDTGERLDCVKLSRLEGVRRGFSLGGRLKSLNYDPLRSLSLPVHRGKKDLTSYNLTAASALSCQRWVDGLQAAIYVHRRMEDQRLAREWYLNQGQRLHATGSRLLHNYLPRNSELRKLRHERTAQLNSFTSNDSGVDSDEGSLENLDLLESYVDIELDPNGEEIKSRDVLFSSLFGQLSLPFTSLSTPVTPAISRSSRPLTPSPLPLCSSDIDITAHHRTTPGLASDDSPASSLCSCHAYQVVTLEWSCTSDRGGRRPRSDVNPHKKIRTSKCCHRCEGHCQTILLDTPHCTNSLLM